MNGMLVILFGSNIEGMKWNHFMTILLLYPYFKINSWIYRGILGVLVKKSLNLILFLPIPPNFERIKIWDFKEINRNDCSLVPFNSLPLKLPNKGMSFPFSPLKLSNKGREEYSKIILFIPFYSIQFPSSKRELRALVFGVVKLRIHYFLASNHRKPQNTCIILMSIC